MNKDKLLIILSGIPGAGKSTYAEKLKEKYTPDCVVSPDEIREMCGLVDYDENGNPLKISTKFSYAVFCIFYNIVEVRMKRGVITVCDGTFVDSGSMRDLRRLARKYGYRIEIHRINCDLETAIERNKHRGYKNVPENDIIDKHERFQEFGNLNWEGIEAHKIDI